MVVLGKKRFTRSEKTVKLTLVLKALVFCFRGGEAVDEVLLAPPSG